MEPQNGVSGETITLRCKCTDISLKPKWFKGDMEIKPSEKYSFDVVDGEFMLIIKNASPKDTDSYSISVENVNASANLSVRDESPLKEPNLQMDPQTGIEGEDVMLICTSNIILKDPKWFKGNTEIFPSDKYCFQMIDGKYSLIIKCSSPDDEDLYSIRANDYEVSANLSIQGQC